MKTKFNILLLSLAAAMPLVSCNDYLDTTPTDSASDKLIWSNYEYAQLQANYMYEDIKLIGVYGTGYGCSRDCSIGLSESLTDLFKYGGYNYTSLNRIPSELAYGGVTLTNGYVDTYLGAWGTMYGYISTANQCISNLKKFGTFAEDQKAEIEAEFRFFRALYYSVLAKRYPELIIYTDNMDEYTKDKAASPVSEAYELIYQDLMFAGENLPVATTPNGRLTSGAAYALLSRVMLYAERWADAKYAAEQVMAQGYSMPADLETPFTNGGEGAIFQFCFDLTAQTHQFDAYYSPGGDKAAYNNPVSGGYGCPTQEMVESFEKATVGGFVDWTRWHNVAGTNDTPPYAELEPRFHHTILYNGAAWKDREIESYVGGADGWLEWMKGDMCDGKSTTSYYLRKLVDENNMFADGAKSIKPYTFIRYAEVLLNYAEACYNLGETAEALAKVNDVRTRPAVNLPALTVSGEKVMDAIRQERKVELAYEGHYYWDMRRWRLAHTAFTGVRAHGLKIEKNANGSFTYYYVTVDDQDRNFPEKMYSCPIPESELDNNKAITQISIWN